MTDAIAIVGMGAVLPPGVGVDGLWELVRQGRDAIAPVPAERWCRDPATVIGSGPDQAPHARAACLLHGRAPDPALLPPAVDPASVDPGTWPLLRACWAAWRDARAADGIDARRCGLFLGSIALPTAQAMQRATQLLGPFVRARAGLPAVSTSGFVPPPGGVCGRPAGLVAQALGLGGPVNTCDAACASGLYAIALAADELRAGRADCMLAGGFNHADALYTQLGFAALGALSRSGHCRPFTAAADGLIVGEGAGLVVLKRLADAEASGDRILGLLAGHGFSNDLGGSLFGPDRAGQVRAMQAAYRASAWQPNDVDLIECHGTGTPKGDAVELASLRSLWGDLPGSAVIGSVKATIGHLLTGAGAAAVLKVLAALRAGELPPQPGLSATLDHGPFRVLHQAESWERAGPRRAAVSAFGFGGINAHLLIEEHQPRQRYRALPAPRSDAIAIVGIGARIGPWADLAELGPILLGRLPAQEPQPLPPLCAEGPPGPRGFWITDLTLPLRRFRIPPAEMADMSAQQALMLLAADEALRDAGVEWGPERPTWGLCCGVELDAAASDFHLRWQLLAEGQVAAAEALCPPLTANRVMGNLGGIVASRLARAFRCGGPSFTVGAGRCSGLEALHTACDLLRSGQLDVAVAGAVDVRADPRALPAQAALPGEGAVAVLCKRLADAERDGDAIYAVIEQTQRAAAITAPAEAVAWDGGAEGPWQVCAPEQWVGDSGAAAGLLQVVGAALGLANRILPALGGSHYWLRNRHDECRRAVVRGADAGFACGIVLREAGAARAQRHPLGALPQRLLVCDAEHLPDPDTAADLWASPPARAWPARPLCLIVDDASRLPGLIERARRAHATGTAVNDQELVYAPQPLGGGGRLAWVYPGSGNHFPDMARALSALWPRVLDRQDAENERLRDQFAGGRFWRSETDYDHPAVLFGQVFCGCLVSDIVADFGIVPDAIIGYSLGETAGLFSTRTWRARDEMLARMQGSPLFTRQIAGPCESVQEAWQEEGPVDWCVGLVPLPARRLRSALAAHPRTYLLIINTPEECVIGGDRQAIAAVVAELGCHFFELQGVTTVHAPVAAPVAAPYRALHLLPTTPPPGLRVYAGHHGAAYAVSPAACAEAIVGQALATLDYTRVIERAYADGLRVFVEMGPGNSCTRMIDAILADRPHAAVAAHVARAQAGRHLLQSLACLIVHGYRPDLCLLSADGAAPAPVTGPRVPIPRGPIASRRPIPPRPPMRETPMPAPCSAAPAPPEEVPRALDRAQCLAFAVGQIGAVLGPRYAAFDAHPTRVRLPAEPLMLVDRITAIEGEPLALGPGRVVTEHDVGARDWYLDGGVIPTAICVESGQADLFLAGFLGIDRITQGRAVYRLLDATVVFHDQLPGPGAVIVYDIRISGFFHQGDTWLFRFQFEASVGGRPLLSMRDGIAGFFTAEALAAGQGVVIPTAQQRPVAGRLTGGFQPLVPVAGIETYTATQLDALRAGDLAGCFGAAFAAVPAVPALPKGRLRLVHRITRLAPGAGRYGLGQIVGEADIHPDDWFLTCHFCDDQVMPGTLMYECCLHTLRVYLLRIGWVPLDEALTHEPVPGQASQLKCRGQVLSTTRCVRYELTLKEIGYDAHGRPYCLADALMSADGKPIVHMLNMSVQIRNLRPAQLRAFWSARTAAPAPRALFTDADITAFAIGKPSQAFGARYRVFDHERCIARLPGPPFKFLNRIEHIADCEPWVMRAGGTIEAVYDLPPEAWYFTSYGDGRMPFCVLLEAALQPCGWLSAYLGSALTSDEDLRYRNLGGSATWLRTVTPALGSLRTRVTMTAVSSSGGMIIQHFRLDMRCAAGPVYSGTTMFGFFTATALAHQVGIREAVVYEPSEAASPRAMPVGAPQADRLLCMVDEITHFLPTGGPAGCGYIAGALRVDPEAWYFKAHFFQDPVTPGSLGLESFCQLLRVWAQDHWPAATGFHSNALNREHRWLYRGQVVPSDERVRIQAWITAIDEVQRIATADGFLSVDGRVIYQMIDFTIAALD